MDLLEDMWAVKEGIEQLVTDGRVVETETDWVATIP